MKSNQSNFVSNFDQLPAEYNRMWLEFTDKSSISALEAENAINQMMTSLTIQEKCYEFNLIVLRLKPDQRVLEGLLMICQMTNKFMYERLEVIEKGGLLLQKLAEWLLLQDTRLLSMNNLVPFALPPTSHKCNEALKTMLQFIIDIMNKFILLVQKVASSVALPEVYKRSESIAAELNRASLYSPQLCTAQPIEIKMILNATVAKSLYVKRTCEGLLAQYRKIMNDIFNPIQPTLQHLNK